MFLIARGAGTGFFEWTVAPAAPRVRAGDRGRATTKGLSARTTSSKDASHPPAGYIDTSSGRYDPPHPEHRCAWRTSG
jgi:hypothetical protein